MGVEALLTLLVAKYRNPKYEVYFSYDIDASASHMYRDNEKCILCRRCVAVCEKNQAVAVIGANARGFDTHIGSPWKTAPPVPSPRSMT